MIEPLLPLRELRDVSLDFKDFLFPYSSSDIQSFAELWPELESFRLEFATQDNHRAKFESLVHFARHCPRLRVLHLPDMELAYDALDGFACPQRSHPLRELNVEQVVSPRGRGLPRDMVQLAQKVFPHAVCTVSAS